ncbi:MAG TPA: DUF6311 domain-containing protein [Terriglobales bacterium]|nr:DUF6311 domain-containing protein [Terriglobales bacterium]
MNTAAASLPGTSSEARSLAASPRGPSRRWHESIWFDLAVALLAGFFYALLVMGPRPLNPRNVNWVAFDPAYHYIGWELYRQDPHLHWPLTYTDRLGYPKGESVSLIDLNPLMAIALKPLSPLLPEPAQYFGIEVILVCALQFFFALRLLRLLTGANVIGIALGSAFFLLAPPLNYRFWGHYSLSNQWLLVAAMYVFARAQQPSERAVRRFAISAAVLVAIAVGINPYLAFEVLLVLLAGVASLLWRKKITLAQSGATVAGLAGIGFFVAYALGLVISGGRGYASGGYRDLSMNVLAPIDPRGWNSLIFPRLHSASFGQYEGYNYLGAGVLLLAAIVVVATLVERKRLQLDKRWVAPLALCCLVLTLLALSTKITMGAHTLVDLDPGQHATALFAPLRATGRLFWAPYYAILAAVLAAPFFLFRQVWATVLIAAALVLQFADTASLRHWVRTTISEQHPSPLKSPVWSKLNEQHQNLIVLPAWQCAHNASPGGPEGYRVFGFLAVQQHMRINSYQSARYTGVAQDYHCTQAVAELSQQPLAPHSAYVVSPALAEAIAQGPTGPGKCHDVDRFILCSVKADFGLSPVLMTPEERVESSVANPGFEDGDLAPWSTNGVEASVSTARAHSGTHSLAEAGGAGTIYQDINGLQPGKTYILSGWVSASPAAASTAQLTVYNPTDNTAVSSAPVAAGPGWHWLQRSFIVGGEGAIRIHLARGPGAGTVYWDDVHLSTGEPK